MIQKLFSLFSKKEAKPVLAARKPTMTAPGIRLLKKDVNLLRTHSMELRNELSYIKDCVTKIPDHGKTIDVLHQKHEAHEKAIASHAEKFNHFDRKLQDQRIDIIELKAKLNELAHSLSRTESFFSKVEELEKRMEISPVSARNVATKIARATAPAGSLLEQYHLFAPGTKKIFSLLLQMHVEHKGKWIALSDLRNLFYPGRDDSNSTLAAMAKAIRPLYETGFVEKKRDKSFVYVAATKRGRDAAKETGLHQQAEKFDAVFAKLDGNGTEV